MDKKLDILAISIDGTEEKFENIDPRTVKFTEKGFEFSCKQNAIYSIIAETNYEDVQLVSFILR